MINYMLCSKNKKINKQMLKNKFIEFAIYGFIYWNYYFIKCIHMVCHPEDKLINILEKLGTKDAYRLIFNKRDPLALREKTKLFRNYRADEKQIGGDKGSVFKVKYHGATFKFHKYKDGKNVVAYRLYRNEDKDKMPSCIYIFIDVAEKYAQINEISQINDCYTAKQIDVFKKNDEKISGRILVKLALRLLKMEKSKYGLKYVTLVDNSQKHCKGENIQLGLMYTLLHGHTWYGTFGFRPADGNQKKIDDSGLFLYNKNIQIMKKTKVKDVEHKLRKIYKYINKKLNRNINVDTMTNKYKNVLLSDYLEAVIDDFDKNCELFREMYRILANEIGVTNFFGNTFILMLD